MRRMGCRLLLGRANLPLCLIKARHRHSILNGSCRDLMIIPISRLSTVCPDSLSAGAVCMEQHCLHSSRFKPISQRVLNKCFKNSHSFSNSSVRLLCSMLSAACQTWPAGTQMLLVLLLSSCYFFEAGLKQQGINFCMSLNRSLPTKWQSSTIGDKFQ